MKISTFLLNRIKQIILFLAVTMILLPTYGWSKVKITWWHAMGGRLGEIVDTLVKDYNNSQDKYEVVATYKGTYDETLNASIAAFRAKKQPHLVQVYEVGTATMMNSKTIYPVYDLMKDAKIKMDWSQFLPPVVSYYQSSKGELQSMPFNSSTPVLFYNKKALKVVRVKRPPATWEALLRDSRKIAKTGKVGLVAAWQSWVLAENFNSINNLPFATKGNGFDGKGARLNFNQPLMVKNITALQRGIKQNLFSYEGRYSDPARRAFLSEKAVFYMDSSSSLATVKKLAKFDFGIVPLPVYKSVKKRNAIIGGASIWVYKGHKKAEYKGVADFLKYMSGIKNQKYWHKETGYLPITKVAYQQLKKEGYYKEEPRNEVAIKQLLVGKPGKYNRGIRLVGFVQIRDIINEEFENIWSGKVSAKAGLARAVERGNKLLAKQDR